MHKKKRRNGKRETTNKIENPMIEYLSSLKILNSIDRTHRVHGNGISIAHSSHHFSPPRLTKGKSVTSKKRKK